MAKEMMIVFVYDTLRCAAEADDPADAVLYFHPGWVSDAQRHALCGQVVGAAHCVKSLLSPPVAVTLQSGKFVIREYGRYVLAIGSDRNIPDWVLQNRAALLTAMIRVYHGDLAAVAALFPDGSPRFAEKLYQMLETYLPVLQYGCHIFQRVPTLTLPKSATSTFMEAMQILEYCHRLNGVLGGVIFYNNKIVASQLPPSLTSHLGVVEPYRVRSPAETCRTAVPLPLGAQLLLVYVARRRHEALAARRAADAGEAVRRCRKSLEAEREKSSREFPPTGMKRDKSLLFTAVPEEDHNLISPPASAGDTRQGTEEKRREPSMPDVVPFTNKPRPRPNKLSFKPQKSLDEEGKENAADKVFTGQTSVCSTPMVEYKRLHGNVLSICQNPDGQPPDVTDGYSLNAEPDVVKLAEHSAKLNVIETAMKDNKILIELNTIGEHYVNKPESTRKLGSVSDIQETIKRLSNRASAKFRLRKTNTQLNDDTSPSPEKHHINMTINDPSFPVFREDGIAISESLYNQYLEQHYNNMNQQEQDMSKAENMFTFNMKVCEQEKIEGFDSDLIRSPQRTPKKTPKDSLKPVDQSRRKSLSLPLKSLSESSDSQIGSESEGPGFSGKKKLGGVQLTPLMEKLSHLAFSDKSSGYSSRVMTPLELREFPTPSVEKNVSFSEQSKSRPADSDSDSDEDLDALPEYSQRSVKCALFVSGLQSMALMVLMELDAADDADTIHTLWETSLNTLGPIEQQCMEPLPTTSESADYSYLTLDPDWGTVKKGGPWASLDIASMGLIHSEFAADPSLSELILRSETSAVLGSTCGGAEVYYAESGPRQPGPPPPSDVLATVQLKAKRRLHRDHSVVIL